MGSTLPEGGKKTSHLIDKGFSTNFYILLLNFGVGKIDTAYKLI